MVNPISLCVLQTYLAHNNTLLNDQLCHSDAAIDSSRCPKAGSPLALALFHTLQAEHREKVLNHSLIIMLKDDLHSSIMDNRTNFLQVAHEENPLLTNRPVGIGHQYNGYSRAMRVVSPTPSSNVLGKCEQDSIVHTMDTQRSAPWGLARISHHKRLGPELSLSSTLYVAMKAGTLAGHQTHNDLNICDFVLVAQDTR